MDCRNCARMIGFDGILHFHSLKDRYLLSCLYAVSHFYGDFNDYARKRGSDRLAWACCSRCWCCRCSLNRFCFRCGSCRSSLRSRCRLGRSCLWRRSACCCCPGRCRLRGRCAAVADQFAFENRQIDTGFGRLANRCTPGLAFETSSHGTQHAYSPLGTIFD